MDALAQFVPPLLGAIAGGVSVYVGIKSDLAALIARVTTLEKSTDQAHTRIDNLLTKGK